MLFYLKNTWMVCVCIAFVLLNRGYWQSPSQSFSRLNKIKTYLFNFVHFFHILYILKSIWITQLFFTFLKKIFYHITLSYFQHLSSTIDLVGTVKQLQKRDTSGFFRFSFFSFDIFPRVGEISLTETHVRVSLTRF